MAYSDEYRSAKQVLATEMEGENKWAALQEEARQRAEDADVTRSEYAGYAEAFANYEARDDVETLADRRAREAGTSATDTDFVRSSKPEDVARTDGIYRSPRG